MATASKAPRRPSPPRSDAVGGGAARRRANTRLAYDFMAITLIALGLILLATLLWPSRPGENIFGSAVVAGMRLMVGAGVWAFPLVLLTSGIMFSVGKSRSWDNVGGAVSIFLLFIGWWHLGHVPPAGHFAQDNLLNYGGYIGAGLSWAARAALGSIGGHILFGALSVAALLALTDIPLPAILSPAERAASTSARMAKNVAINQATRRAERRADVQRERLTLPTRERESDDPHSTNPDEKAERNPDRLAREEKERQPSRFVRKTAEPTMNADETDSDDPSTVAAPASRPSLFSFGRKNSSQEIEIQPELPLESPVLDEEPGDAGTFAIVPAPGTDEKPAGKAPKFGRGVDPNAPALEDTKKFNLPSLNLLKSPVPQPKMSVAESEERRDVLLQTLEDFGIGADIANVTSGPTITRYEIALERGIKVSKIVSLADNLAMALAAIDVRVEAPIPGKSAIGIEVPNAQAQLVTLRECIDRPEFMNAPSKLTFALGKDVTGVCRYADLAKMPHLLIGGSTGSGKSAGLNSFICSLLYRCTPRELKFLMIDPKKVELSLYDGIPHLASPVITNVKQAPSLFKQAIKEMEARYDKFAKIGTRNIEGYNGRVNEEDKLPYWVIVVDELADLMMTSGPDIESSICRLAQLARATGIHLVIATQRPSVNVITGTIKANISSRIAFAVNSAVDSRTILDATGADRLLGRGDMLFMPIDAAKPMRVQGCFVSEQETEALVTYLKSQAQPTFEVLPSVLTLSSGEDDSGETEADDELFEGAVKLVVSGGSASTSMLQRRFKIGYTRAARLVDMMELRGVVGPLDGAKPRDILISRDQADAMFLPNSPAE